jgi:chromosome partitioning protein
MKLEETIAFALGNHKGGAGKTTTTDGFIYSLANLGYKVLVIDADPQMNLSYSYGFRQKEKNLHVLLMDVKEEIPPESQIYHTDYHNIDIIVADTGMATIEMDLTVRLADRDRIVQRIVNKLKALKEYDFIVFDTNPSLGLLNYNVFMAIDYLIIPVECSAYGIEGISHIKDFFSLVQKYNTKLEIAGVVLSKVEGRHTVAKLVMQELKDNFGEYLLDTIIEKDESVAQAQLVKQPIVSYGTSSRGHLNRTAMQFKKMTKEVLKRVNVEQVKAAKGSSSARAN